LCHNDGLIFEFGFSFINSLTAKLTKAHFIYFNW